MVVKCKNCGHGIRKRLPKCLRESEGEYQHHETHYGEFHIGKEKKWRCGHLLCISHTVKGIGRIYACGCTKPEVKV